MRGVNRVSQLSDVLVLGCVRVLAAKLAVNRNGYAAIGSSIRSVSMHIGPKSPGFADCNQPETSLHI